MVSKTKDKKQKLAAPISEPDLEKKLEGLLKECEDTLLKMSLVESRGGKLEDYEFYTPVFRFIWTKIASLLGEKDPKKQSKFYKKGTGF